MERICRTLFLVVFLLLFAVSSFASRGISLEIKAPNGAVERVPLYKESHALLIGVSDYTNGWPDLTSIPKEMDELEKALRNQGFNVVKTLNPDSNKLADAFESFINDYGFDPENRLLFFFSGHGYSRPEVEKGYIVPADAPSPLADRRGFARKAIEMDRIVTWAKRIEAKHAMFLFDSCFSGTVFQSRALPSAPPHINSMVARPIRQFISAGSAGEEVPAKSYFVPSFIRAIEGEGDLDQDGYITGTELGMYLNRKVSGYQVGQTPQFGKIRDPRLDQGDFVMLAGLNRFSDVRQGGPEMKKTGTLELVVKPRGASVYIDGKYQGAAPLTLTDLAGGRSTVMLKKSGYKSYEGVVLIRDGRKVSLDVSLERIVTTENLKVESVPSGAAWYLDGAYVGQTPDVMDDLNPGSYHVKVMAQGYADFSETVLVRKGQDSRLVARLQKKSFIQDQPVRNNAELLRYESQSTMQSSSWRKKLYVFGGGPAGGTFQTVANAIQSYRPIKEMDRDGVKIKAQSSGGSIANLRNTDNGKVAFSTVYSGHLYLGMNGLLKNDRRKYDDVRAVAYLYGSPAQLVVRKGSGIKSTRDLAGKRVGVGNAGSGAFANAELFFRHMGVWDKIERNAMGYNDASRAFGDNQLDAFWLFTMYPSGAAIMAAQANDIELIDLGADAAESGFYDKYPYFARLRIPGGTYRGVRSSVGTFQDSALWVANKDVPADVVYNMLKAIFTDEGLKHMVSQKKTFRAMAVSKGADGIVTPMHPGAIKFWKEQGVL